MSLLPDGKNFGAEHCTTDCRLSEQPPLLTVSPTLTGCPRAGQNQRCYSPRQARTSSPISCAVQRAGEELREYICSIILGLRSARSLCDRADREVALLSEHLKSRLLSQLHAFLKVHRLLIGNFMERGNKRKKKKAG